MCVKLVSNSVRVHLGLVELFYSFDLPSLSKNGNAAAGGIRSPVFKKQFGAYSDGGDKLQFDF
jgi:hypothetical protein